MRSGLPLRLIQHQVFPSKHTRLIPQLCWQLLSRRKCILDPLFSLPNSMFLLLLALLVDVFAAFSGLAAELWERSACVQGLISRTYHDGVWWRASNHHHLANTQPPIPALKSRRSRDCAQLLGGRHVSDRFVIPLVDLAHLVFTWGICHFQPQSSTECIAP